MSYFQDGDHDIVVASVAG